MIKLNLSQTDLGWIAGFLEGEGSFCKCGNTIMVCASQVQKEPLERLYQLLGGGINEYSSSNYIGNIIYRWCAYGPKAAEIMLEVYHLMSSKRKEQIKDTLLEWGNKPMIYIHGGYSLDERNVLNTAIFDLA